MWSPLTPKLFPVICWTLSSFLPSLLHIALNGLSRVSWPHQTNMVVNWFCLVWPSSPAVWLRKCDWGPAAECRKDSNNLRSNLTPPINLHHHHSFAPQSGSWNVGTPCHRRPFWFQRLWPVWSAWRWASFCAPALAPSSSCGMSWAPPWWLSSISSSPLWWSVGPQQRSSRFDQFAKEVNGKFHSLHSTSSLIWTLLMEVFHIFLYPTLEVFTWRTQTRFSIMTSQQVVWQFSRMKNDNLKGMKKVSVVGLHPKCVQTLLDGENPYIGREFQILANPVIQKFCTTSLVL